ncbi:TLC domain-containing protein [Ascoidea rubescens DSM 1968]|uniref:DUF887-domain-containing protein n=1 Tax=Ascoidea rubescens DSM 1968 TaxID=1344418 RepID=A0A1D2VRR8_9ASCO|nr:DUF887-domain-containing protein [Ascoidea rubescens DSM 1968]ODV64278.1 DUF887-domain-containing protein [Ascoidea rubescens DSM 1968]
MPKYYYQEDYFLKFSPLYNQYQQVGLTNEVDTLDSLKYYKLHLHEILFSVLFYSICFYLSPIILKYLLKENYTKLKKSTKVNFDIHFVSMIQCIISNLIIMPLFQDPDLKAKRFTNYTPYAGLVSSLTIGYFIWDLIMCIFYFKLFGFGFLLHAVSSLIVFTSTLKPFLMYWIPRFLIFELSSPFVNINWFVNKLPSDFVPLKVQIINGLLLIVTFFSVRIVWGFYAAYKVIEDFCFNWEKLDLISRSLGVFVMALNIGLDILNVFWFQKMISIAIKHIRGDTKKKGSHSASKLQSIVKEKSDLKETQECSDSSTSLSSASSASSSSSNSSVSASFVKTSRNRKT